MISDDQEPIVLGSKRFFVGIGLGLTFVIFILVYFLYNAYKQNQRLQVELDTLNENKGSAGDMRSEETDSEYYKQMNKNEEMSKPKTPPSSPTIEDYDSGNRKKKSNLDWTNLSPLNKRNSDDGEKRFVSKFDIDGRRDRTNTSD